jgi:ribosomal protein S18 acetylase RimI-like enzyme
MAWLRLMLEPAREADVPIIVDLVNQAFRGRGDDQSWNVEDFIEGPRIDEAAVRDDIEEDLVHLLVHRDAADGRLVATVRLEPSGGGTWHLGMLSVAPDQQARQLGRRVMEVAEAFVRGQGGRRVRLSVVDCRETLIAWYIRRGYRLTGETMPFPYDDQRFGRPLRNDLAFVMLEKTL